MLKKRLTKKRRRRVPVRTAGLARRRVQEGATLKDISPFGFISPPRSWEYILGFDSTVIPGLRSASITKSPQVIFRPERVVIPSTVGIDFQVIDIRVGKNSQFTSRDTIPAVVFAETTFGVRLKMDICQVSMDVTISVRNTNAAARNFIAIVIGTAVSKRNFEEDMERNFIESESPRS